jgi:outer membrane phospholipase A
MVAWNLNSQTTSPALLDDLAQPTTEPDTRNTSPDVISTLAPANRLTPASAATQPEAASAAAGNFTTVGGAYGLGEFANHFAPYEPMYIVGGEQSPNVKFQFSFRYRILTPTGPLATDYPLLKGFNFAYSQTSLWDFSGPSSPFFYDSSYRPEFFYLMENLPGVKLPEAWQVGFQTGIQHESNGQGGLNERSLNIVYFRPIVTLSDARRGLFITLAPEFYGYVFGLADNPDISLYRGYDDLRIVVGQRDGLQLAAQGHVGYKFSRGDIQLDLTYPITKILRGNADLSIDFQYFDGYGESLLAYNQRSSIFRVGFNLVR